MYSFPKWHFHDGGGVTIPLPPPVEFCPNQAHVATSMLCWWCMCAWLECCRATGDSTGQSRRPPWRAVCLFLDLARFYRHSSPPPTTPTKNLGTPHTIKITPNISDPMPTSCTNVSPNHHAHSGSSHPPTSDGCNLHHQQKGRFLVTLILHPHQASIPYNSSDLAYLSHTAHYYVMWLVRSNFIPQPPHLTSTLSSLWKIHTP